MYAEYIERRSGGGGGGVRAEGPKMTKNYIILNGLSLILFKLDGLQNDLQIINDFIFHSKAKLERIKSLVICHYNKYQEFNSDCLSHFTFLRHLYIGQSLFQTFLTKIPKLDYLEVSFEMFY